MQAQENYKNNKLHGEQITLHNTGKVKSLINYVNGEKDGTSTFYSESGKLTKEIDYKKGTVIRECTYKE